MTPPFIVKVCGVTSRADAQSALDAGANALGFNFYPKSPRYIRPEAAVDLISGLRGGFLRVGVFVLPIQAEPLGMDVLQLHGAGAFKKSTTPIWKAVPAGSVPPADSQVEAWLLDTFTPAFGGSGKTFPWTLAASFPHRCIVAGGLDADNVAEAIRIAQPWGVDACSRLEASPGKKDPYKVEAFAHRAWQAFHAQQAVNI